MRNRAKHTWLAVILVANFPNRATGQVDLAVSVLGTTATQAMLSYTAPTDAPCIVEASDPPEYWQPLHDIDLLTFEGANSDGRGGRQRTILIGTPLTEVGRGNTAHSWVLEPDTPYYFRLTCGQAVVTGTFRTLPPTNGITYSDARLPSQPGPVIPAIADSISHRPPPVPPPWRPPWRLRRPSAHSCVSNGTGGGVWDSPATWTGCAAGVPDTGDTAALSDGDTVTIPPGYRAIAGISDAGGPEGTAAVKCTSERGTGKLVINGSLTFRGNIEQCSAVWRVGQDAIIEHDSSLAPAPGTTHYRWIIGTYLWPDAAQLVIRGTRGHRAIIRNAIRSGTFYGFTYTRYSNQGSGQFDFEYVTIDGCGGITPCVDTDSHSSSIPSIARCDHCLVTDSGYFGAATNGDGTCGPLNVISITNSTLTLSADPNGYVLRPAFRESASVTLDTIFTTGVIVLAGANGEDAPGTHLRNIVQQANALRDSITTGGANFRIAEFDRILRITDQLGGGSSSSYTDVPGGNATRLMCLMNSNLNPLCFLGPLGISGQDDSIDGAYFEKIGTGTDGDFILGANGPATVTTIRNTVGVCSTTDGYLGSLSSQVTSSIKKFILTQNTYCGKDDGQGSARGFGYEVPGTAPVGFLTAAKNNIVFCATNVACYLVHKGPTGTDSVGTYQNVDYNWKWNVATGPYLNIGTAYSPNPPGVHDSSGDPQFVQQRHFLDWGQMLKASISTWTDIVAEFAKMNDDVGYDSRFTIENAYNWLRDGYRPQNPSLMTAGEAGSRVGAMDSGSQR